MKLTGRTRHRHGWRGRLILQVEYAVRRCRDLNGSGYFDEWSENVWADATASDLTVVEQFFVTKPVPNT